MPHLHLRTFEKLLGLGKVSTMSKQPPRFCISCFKGIHNTLLHLLRRGIFVRVDVLLARYNLKSGVTIVQYHLFLFGNH